MKIGILTFAFVPNFGANLQALSTYYYFKNRGDEPILINWTPNDFQRILDAQKSSNVQSASHFEFVKAHMNSTNSCTTSKEVAEEIERNNIDAIVIGSDAVLQHHPLLARIQFPAKTFFYVNRMNSSVLYPNPFWGEFIPFLKREIPIVMMSGSNQSSKYKYIWGATRVRMSKAIDRFSYFSVRDDWTRKMIVHITKGKVCPPVTPDPVFAFNYNCQSLLKSKEQILNKYHLPDKYILFSLLRRDLVDINWLRELKQIAHSKGMTLVALPMPNGVVFEHPFDVEIECPLSPLDWFALIKYSCGYIGQNMHPTVVSLANSVPVFCFDNYIRPYFYRLFANEKASKVYHILSEFGHPENRCSISYRREQIPSPDYVFSKLLNFDKFKCGQIADKYLNNYLEMMSKIEKIFLASCDKNVRKV